MHVVAGAGIAGLSLAWYLAKAGKQVTLLDANEPAQHTSWQAAGMLAPINELEFQETEMLLAGRAARAHWNDFATELGITLDTTGSLEVALGLEDVEYLQRLYHHQRLLGLPVQWLDANALNALEPNLNRQLPAAIYSAEDAQVEHHHLLPALLKAVQDAGVDIRPYTPVTGYKATENGIEISTPNGSIQATVLCLATGYHALNAKLQLPQRIYPIRGQMLALEAQPPPLLHHIVRIRSKTYGPAYLVPKPERLLVGSTSEEMGADTRLTAGGIYNILRKAYHVLPAVYDLHVLDSWSGLRPSTLSRMPVVGAVPGQPGVFVLNGLYRHGILLGPYIASALAAHIQGQKWPAELHPFVS